MSARSSAELIVTDKGRIYHLDLAPDEIPDTILTVGDPQRVARVSKHFDKILFKREHREFVTHRGRIGREEVMVISTGMGTDNIEIFMTELDALVNVDLTDRTVKQNIRSLNIIRIGTSGALQEHIPVGSLLASSAGVGMDTLMSFYSLPMTNFQNKFVRRLQEYLGLDFRPYMAEGDTLLVPGLPQAITLTCPGFFAPQGRKVRLEPSIQQLTHRLQEFMYDGLYLSNLEMETSGMYAMGQLMGHSVCSTNAIIANRATDEFSEEPQAVVDKLITTVLEGL